MDDFAAILVAARRHTGRTQAQVAIAAGLTPSYLSFLENRKKPPPSDEVCRKLAKVLKVPAKRLLDLAHIQRAPESVRIEVRSLRHSLKRERRSRTRALKALLSPFLFAGPPGYLDSALDTLQISPARRRRLRAALRAGAGNAASQAPFPRSAPAGSSGPGSSYRGAPAGHNASEEERSDPATGAELVASIIDQLSERDRAVLIEALPRLMDKQVRAHLADLAAAKQDAAERAERAERGAGATGGEGGTKDAKARGVPETTTGENARQSPQLLYGAPPANAMPAGLYLIEALGPDLFWPDSVREHDLLLVDPRVLAGPGDLVLLRGGEAGQLRRLEELGSAPIESARRFVLRGPGETALGPAPLGSFQLERYLAAESAGTVIEIRRPLRPPRAQPWSPTQHPDR